ncbi:MAG TPA: AmmeMemoRadiSam system protein A [Candidatus Acidoferrales bacterium]|nr:AmmeMemoRadiSam system protein A [Candidatus Acidoferrales bacterium]
MNSTLSKDEQRALLKIARRALVETIVFDRRWRPEAEEGSLAEPLGAFVTLEHRGRLRGCVGQPAPQDSLARTVAHCAVAAAQEDTRFRPVRAGEVAELAIEISVLSSMQPIALGQIEIGRHGLFVVRDVLRALLLPQVAAERNWTRERFLQETCRKAGLPTNSWRLMGTQLYGFTAEAFNEAEFAPEADSTAVSSSQHSPY